MNDREIINRNRKAMDKLYEQFNKNVDLLIKMKDLKGFRYKIYRSIIKFCIKINIKLWISYMKESLDIIQKICNKSS